MPRSKPIAVLLDANVIIESFRVSVWDAIIQNVDIYVPSIVIREVHALPSKRKRGYVPVDLSSHLRNKKITEISATAQEMAELEVKYKSIFSHKELDDGEKEALALACANRPADAVICTADGTAIQTIAMIDMKDRAISLEEMLKKIGHKKQLRNHFCESFMNDHLETGAMAMIMDSSLSVDKKKTKRKK